MAMVSFASSSWPKHCAVESRVSRCVDGVRVEGACQGGSEYSGNWQQTGVVDVLDQVVRVMVATGTARTHESCVVVEARSPATVPLARRPLTSNGCQAQV